MRTVIIEDEIDAQDLLSNILLEYCPSIEVVGITDSIDSGENMIKELKPDLMFLDIEIEGGNSFQLLDRINFSAIKIIFTTAFDEFALHAFKYGAIDYLLKPYSPQDVIRSIDRIKNTQYDHAILNRLDSLINQNGSNINKRISIPTSDGLSIISVNDITRVEADQSYCMIYLSDGQKLLVSKPLKSIEAQLNSTMFYRVHTTHLINLDFINKYSKEDGGYVVMNDGSQVPISRRRKQAFLDLINQ